MVLLLAALSVMSQAPETRSPVAVVVSSMRPNAETYSSKIAGRVLETLRKEGVGPLLDDASASRELKQAGVDPKGCAGGQSCVAKLAVLLGPKAVVVGVDVGKVAKSLAIHIEAMAADSDEPLVTVDFVAAAEKWADKSGSPISSFVAQLKEKLVIKKRPPAIVRADPEADAPPTKPLAFSDAPKKTSLEPRPTDLAKKPLAGVTASTKSPKTGAWVLAGASIATAVVAGTFAGLGFADKATFDSNRIDLGNGQYASRLTQEQATGLAGSANTKLTVALSTAIVSAALAGVSIVLFTRD